MANRTKDISPDHFRLGIDEVGEARKYFEEYLPGAIYDSESDSYHYRGRWFDYFKSFAKVPGVPLLKDNCYALLHKQDDLSWFTVWRNNEGHDEQWNAYLKQEERYKKKKREKSFFYRIINKIKKRR